MRQIKFLKAFLLLFVAVLFSVTNTNLAAAATTNKASSRIQNNIFISGLNVSGMTETEALSLIKASKENSLKSSTLVLGYKSTVWRFKYADIGVSFNYTKAISDAMKIVRKVPDSTSDGAVTTDSTLTVTTGQAIEFPRVDIKLTYSFNNTLLVKAFDTIKSKIAVKPIDARLKTTAGKFEIVPEKNGLTLDTAANQKRLVDAVQKGTKTKVMLVTKAVIPNLTKDNLLNVNDKLSEFTTYFSPNYKNRVVNIQLAAKNVTNIILMPGEVISIDKAMGPRYAQFGYLPAHVILGNRMVDAIAGGICQVSTTFYNTALLANLQIVERSNHSLPSTYVKLGRDATINGTNKDLKVRNNTGNPLYIVNKMGKNSLTFTIYGKNPFPDRKVVIKTKILSSKKPTISYIDDPTLPKGKKVEELPASTAYTVESFREVYEGKKLLYVEKLDLDKYRLVNGIIRVGTKQD